MLCSWLKPRSHPDPLDFIQRHVVRPPIIELGGTGAGVVRHCGRFFQRAAVLEVSGNPGRPKRVIADQGGDASGLRSAADHGVGVGLGQGRASELIGAAANCREQRRFRLGRQASLVQVGVQPGLEVMVAGHVVPLAALLPQADPKAAVLGVDVLNPHAERRADPGEAVDHQSDQGAVAQPYRPGHVDVVEQRPRLVGGEHRRLAPLGDVARSTHRGGRVGRDHLAGHQPVEQATDSGQALLGGRGGQVAGLLLDPGRDMEGLDGRD